MQTDRLLERHVFVFNEEDNGGEQLSLTTTFHDNGDDKDNVYTSQELSLQSYCNNASFTLCGCQITPEKLRKLADELVLAKIRATTRKGK